MVDVNNLCHYVKKMSFKDKIQLSDDVYEVKQHTMKIVEKYPIHCGNTVLQLSKLILMKFVMFLYEYLEKDSFELVYSGKSKKCYTLKTYLLYLDTDSICLCATGNLDDLVKPTKRGEWATVKKEWFVLDPNDAYDARFPGKMKLEWESDVGKIIWLVYFEFYKFIVLWNP